MSCGVYQITNRTNGKCYTGSSQDVEKRWSVHRWGLRNGRPCSELGTSTESRRSCSSWLKSVFLGSSRTVKTAGCLPVLMLFGSTHRSSPQRKWPGGLLVEETSIEKESIWMPRPKTLRGLQVTCRGCRAYGFPHRLGGGRCTGDDWAESYYLFERELCETCNCNHNGQCEVATGQEHIRECEGYQEHLRMQCPPAHPTNEEELARQLEEE